jgi:hypothetical protein
LTKGVDIVRNLSDIAVSRHEESPGREGRDGIAAPQFFGDAVMVVDLIGIKWVVGGHLRQPSR